MKLRALILVAILIVQAAVIVPAANAVSLQAVIGRLAFRAMSPLAIAGMATGGTGAIIGVAIGTGIGYLILKSGALQALKNWWDAQQAYPAPVYPTSAFNYTAGNGTIWHCVVAGASTGCGQGYIAYAYTDQGNYINNGGNYYQGCPTGSVGWNIAFNALMAAVIANGGGAGHYGTTPQSYPNTTQDYQASLESNPPSLPAGSVYATPGAAAALQGGAAILSAQTGMTNADLDQFINGSAATVVDAATGAQDLPVSNDNTLSNDASKEIPLLQQIMNYVANLVGIKTGVEETKTAVQSVKTSVDNVGIIAQAQKNAIDNLITLTGAQTNTLDNIGVGIRDIESWQEVIDTDIKHLTDNIVTTTATQNSLSVRVAEVRDLAATKFPFSVIATVSEPSVQGSYTFASLPITSGISIPINPLAGPFAEWLAWARQLLVYMFWCLTIGAIVKRAMSI